MRVVYQEPIQELLWKTIKEAQYKNRTIEYVYLTYNEWNELEQYLYYASGSVCPKSYVVAIREPFYPGKIVYSDDFANYATYNLKQTREMLYMGVKIRLEYK